jgi:hypothetical protein
VLRHTHASDARSQHDATRPIFPTLIQHSAAPECHGH